MCFPVIIKPPQLKLRHKLMVLPKIRPGPDPCCVIACCGGVRHRHIKAARSFDEDAIDLQHQAAWSLVNGYIHVYGCHGSGVSVMPVHVNDNHWALLAADVAGRMVALVDSLPSAQRSCTCSRHT